MMIYVGTTTTNSKQITNANIQYGWVCPKCGKVMAPWCSECNCSYSSPKITCDDEVPADWLKDMTGSWWEKPNATWEIPIHDFDITL